MNELTFVDIQMATCKRRTAATCARASCKKTVSPSHTPFFIGRPPRAISLREDWFDYFLQRHPFRTLAAASFAHRGVRPHTVVNWINHHLEDETGLSISNLTEDLRDGTIALFLLETLGGQSLQPWHKVRLAPGASGLCALGLGRTTLRARHHRVVLSMY